MFRIELSHTACRKNLRLLVPPLVWMLCLFLSLPTQADEPPRAERVADYVRRIGEVQQSLDTGNLAEARQTLNGTDVSLRSFEHSYLEARIQAAPETGPAPDLVRSLAKPGIETRYGVLNKASLHLVYIARDGSLHIYDLKSPAATPKRVAHPAGAAVWSGEFSSDGKVFFSGHQNGDVLVWDASKWEPVHTVNQGSNWPVRILAAAPDGKAFVAESEKTLELWSLQEAEPKKVASLGERYSFGEGLAYSPKGDVIATGGMFDILLHDAKTGRHLRSMRHASYTMGLEFSPDGTHIASAPRGNVNRFIAVFDVTKDQPLFNAGPFPQYIAGMAFTRDGKRIAATGCETAVKIFDAQSGTEVLHIKRPQRTAMLAISHDGRLLGWSEETGYKYILLTPNP